MIALNFPKYPIKLKKKENSSFDIFDEVRKKWLQLTPEEWVRQHWIHHLMSQLEVPIMMIGAENQFKLGPRKKRTDLIVWKNEKVHLIVECKSPDIQISENTLNQILNYQRHHRAKYLVLSNGINHFSFQIDEKTSALSPLKSIPSYKNW